MIVYLHGFASGPQSHKARLFREALTDRGVTPVVPALDEGDFAGLTLSRQLALLERICAGTRPLALIGSSLGGYLAALHAARHPSAVDALVLMAPALDFAARWRERLGPAAMEAWERDDALAIEHFALKRTASIGFGLMRDAEQHPAYPRVIAPALVFHGVSDDVVPLSGSERWVAETPTARLVRKPDGHELAATAPSIVEEAIAFLGSQSALREAHPGLGA